MAEKAPQRPEIKKEPGDFEKSDKKSENWKGPKETERKDREAKVQKELEKWRQEK